jgi:hypothetical protein
VDHEIRLSTTSEENLSRTFAANVGADATVVERSDWTFSTSDGHVGEVQPFNYVVDLQTPFFYNPSDGKNLLYEEFFPRGMSAPAPVDQVAGPILQIVGNSGTDVSGPATYGPRQVDTPILQFTFVPVDPCDVNRDGVCGVDDIDSMTQMLIDDTATHEQRTALIVGTYPEGLNSFFGDANLDGEFNTGDLVQVLGAGKYETEDYAGWAQGDWNGDGVFGTGDLVKALEDGGYEMGPREETAAVPEPTCWLLLLMGLLPGLRRRPARSSVQPPNSKHRMPPQRVPSVGV